MAALGGKAAGSQFDAAVSSERFVAYVGATVSMLGLPLNGLQIKHFACAILCRLSRCVQVLTV